MTTTGKYFRADVDRPQEWEEVSVEFVKEKFGGYYDAAGMPCLLQYLHTGQVVRTPFGLYRAEADWS